MGFGVCRSFSTTAPKFRHLLCFFHSHLTRVIFTRYDMLFVSSCHGTTRHVMPRVSLRRATLCHTCHYSTPRYTTRVIMTRHAVQRVAQLILKIICQIGRKLFFIL